MDTKLYAKHINVMPIADQTDEHRRYKDYCRNTNIERWLDSDKLSAALGWEQASTNDFLGQIYMATFKDPRNVGRFQCPACGDWMKKPNAHLTNYGRTRRCTAKGFIRAEVAK